MALRKENPLPQFKVASYKCLGIWLSFEDPTTLLPGGGEEGRIGRLRSLEKMPPKYAIFSTVLSKIAGTLAWERLQKEYRHTKLVVNAHMDEIVNLTPVKENSFEKAREYYEGLTKNYDALQTLGEADMLRGFVMTTLKKLPPVKPDLVRVDEHWAEWSMKELTANLQKWLKRNKVDDLSTDTGD